MNKMNNYNYKDAKRFIMIPTIVYAVMFIAFIGLLAFACFRVYLFIVYFIELFCIIFAPLPCLILSYIGTVYSYRCRKMNNKAGGLFALGIVDILISISLIVLFLYMIFVLGPSV